MRCSARAPFGVMGPLLLRACVLFGVSLFVTACASSHASYDAPSNAGVGVHGQVAMSAPSKVELEDDGLAVQPPPRTRKYAEPDDPGEPFSPNYGPAPGDGEPTPDKPAPQRAAGAPPVEFRSRTTEMTPAEAQSIIVQAMIAHEQRNP